MLTITLPSIELFNEETLEFVKTKEQTLQLEHSLVSLSKWESKWEKPFLTQIEKTREESIDYIRCMTLTQNVDPNVYKWITDAVMETVGDYIDKSMTATILPSNDKVTSREIVTAEIIYYWMIALTIPLECQKWHLNRLLTLINVCSIKNDTSKKKMSPQEVMSRNRSLNEARRKAMNTRG